MKKQRSFRRRKVKDDATVHSGTSVSTITCDDLSGFEVPVSRPIHDKRRSAPGTITRNLLALKQEEKKQQQTEYRTRRSIASFDLPLMEDDSDSMMELEMEAPRRQLSTRNVMASEDSGLEQVECGFRPRASVSCLDFGDTLTALDVSQVVDAVRTRQGSEEEQEEEKGEEDQEQANVGEQDETYFDQNMDYISQSTFAKNMDFITTRASYFAQNVNYVQERTERLTQRIGGVFTLGRFTSKEDLKTEAEIRSLLDIGTKVEVLEVMYSPEQVARVLKKLHVHGARQMRR